MRFGGCFQDLDEEDGEGVDVEGRDNARDRHG